MSNVASQGIQLGNLLIPWLVIIAFVIAIVFYILLKYSHFGREVYAVGSNREAAHLRGINCKPGSEGFSTSTITGILCGTASFAMTYRQPDSGISIQSNTGNGSGVYRYRILRL